MKNIMDKLFQPFVSVTLFWILFSIVQPLRSYNEENIEWKVFGLFLIVMTVLLGYYTLRSNKDG